jgi:hypothetical protein
MSNNHLHQATQSYLEIAACPENDQPHRLAAALHRLYALLLHRVPGPIRFWYALRLASGSFFGCTRILLSKKHWAVDFGPLLERLPCGCLVPDERTDARSAGTQEIESRYPWANIVELQMFLEGFDMGEQFARRTSGKSAQVNVEASSTSHSERCILQAKTKIPIDMLKRLWYKSQYELPRFRNPRQGG